MSKGQTLSITLFDFGIWRNNSSSPVSAINSCRIYANIVDSNSSIVSTICGGESEGDREKVVYDSASNIVRVSVLLLKQPYFLIKYRGTYATYLKHVLTDRSNIDY